MTTKWEFLDHPDGTEPPYLYDDQQPPSYVEKTSAGVWSLVKTGILANREDQSAGNNWDYISDNGTTVSFYFKSWDAGGYWSGPYLRATWPSNSSGDTITVTNVNNGNFYLKQPASSSGGGPGTLSISSGSLVYDQSNSKIVWTIDSGSPSTSSDVYGITWAVTGSSTNNYGPLNYPTDTTADITSSDPLTGIWQLTHINTSTGITRLLDQLTIGSNLELVTQKKVFCNFW